MNRESAVQFASNSRIHVALAVSDLERSIAFYRILFGQRPTKTRPGYAKFEVAEPAVNLALNAVGGATAPNNATAHFGVQVKSTDAVTSYESRFAAAGVSTRGEHVDCCYAVQNKFWATDPDGNRWEVFVVLDDAGTSYAPSVGGACCPQMEPVVAAFRQGDLATAKAGYDQATAGGGCCTPAGSACCSPASA